MLEQVLKQIYHEEVDPNEGEIPQDLFNATRDLFEKASAKGMAQSDNKQIYKEEDFLKKFDRSIETFSAFRVHTYSKFLADALYEKDGSLKSFEDWKYETRAIRDHFNNSWLKTEYSTAVIRAEQAADWKMFERDKDVLPNLRWMPTSSATPREEHAVFWQEGLTLPVDDPFWNSHHPGDLWNCKCYLEQTDDKVTSKSDMPEKKDMPKPSPGLESNPGKKAEMVSRKHPYYPEKDTCIWLKLARQGGAKARLKRFFNGEEIECKNQCNVCDIFNSTNKPMVDKTEIEF